MHLLEMERNKVEKEVGNRHDFGFWVILSENGHRKKIWIFFYRYKESRNIYERWDTTGKE